jgi:hypothetical protein
MKKLLILPLLVLLTGCVSYYYPETAFEDGVYYAEDDPSYVVYSGGYTSGVYYPWHSLDYFYLGYYPSPAFSFGYAYPSGFSIGFNYGFSPWYYPSHYYGYYSPWYGSHHHHHYYPAWRPYRGYYSRHHDDRYYKNHYRDDRYAGNDRNDRRNRYDDRNLRNRDDYSRERNHSSSVRRYVSTAPGGQSSSRGMVVQNREAAKVGKSRQHLDQSAPKQAVTVSSERSRAVNQPTFSTKRSGTEVRYRSNAKQTRSRPGPVSPAANSNGPVVKAAPANGGAGFNSNGARQTSPAGSARQAPARVVSKPATSQQKPSRATHSRSNTAPARVTQAPSKRSSETHKSSRSGNRK